MTVSTDLPFSRLGFGDGLTHAAIIISCARSSMSSLQEESISVLPKLTTESPLTFSPNILVSSVGSFLWSLPVDECQNWFVSTRYSPPLECVDIYQAFVSHFWEYWPRLFRVTYNEKVVTAEDWPRILAIAKKSSIRLSIEFR